MKKKKSIFKVLTSAGMVALASVGVATVSADGSTNSKYYTAYDTEEEAVKAAVELQRKIAGEGDVLLKNKDNALPLKSADKISVFGGRQNNVLGVSKSSGGTSSGSGGITLAEALTDSGFKVNPVLDNFYQNNTTSIGKENINFDGRVEASLDQYSDAAVIILSREGGEGSDASRVTSETTDEDDFEHQALYKDKEGNEYKHYLMLTNEEEDLIKYVKKHFSKIVVVINSSNAMEVASLKNDDAISAILNVGRPGEGGLYGLGDILNGTVSPSGSLVDEWMTDFTTDPTWYNFGSNNQSGGSNTYYYQDGTTATGSAGTSTAHDNEGYHGVDYEEGIYLGYKYYETVYNEIANGNITYDASKPLGQQLIANASSAGRTEETITKAESWWKNNVAYQYGYGLSYTSFSFNISGVYTNEGCTAELGNSGLADKFSSTATKEADIESIYVKVRVTNTGNVAGKKTVQLYATTPYTSGGVEKASVSLVGFGKSNVIAPGKSEDVVIKVNVQDIASYDYKNLSGVVGADGGYVLEQGKYTLRAMDSSHFSYQTDVNKTDDAYDEANFTLDKSVELVQDDYSGNEVKNLFTDNSIGSGSYMSDGAKTSDILSGTTEEDMHDVKYNSVRTSDMMADGTSGMTILSRSNMVSTFPKAPTLADRTVKNSVLNYFSYWDNFRVSTEYEIDSNGFESNNKVRDASHDYESDPWYKESVPSNWRQATGTYDENHMVENNRTKTKFPMWVSSAAESPIKFYSLAGKDINDKLWDDFLNQLTYDELCSVVEFGGYSTVDIKSVGKGQSMDTDGPNNLDGTVAWTSEDILAATFNVDLAYEEGKIMGNIGLLHGVQGWYGPGADTHRSPFSGRNNEYYSQDAIHAGYMGAAEVQGVQAVGVIPYIKHCLMNDMETDRGTMFVWADEQTIRESGAKQFQIILQEGQCKAAMTGYARLCGLNNTNNYHLGVELYQNQWGSNAYFVTDGYIGWRTRTDLDSMVRTGNQMELYTTPFVEYLSGEWKADANNPNGGMVYVEDLNSNAEDHLVASPTQWYWVRKSAQAILYQVANSAGQYNGYSELAIQGETINATQGVQVSKSLSIANALTQGSVASYSSKNLPAGLTLDSYTGTVSGKVTTPGTYDFTVDYVIDGWIKKSAKHSIVVTPSIKFTDDSDDLTAINTGDDIYAEITSDIYTKDKYDDIQYTVKSGKLPAGLTLSDDGKLTGTPTEAGTFDVVIGLEAIKVTSSKKGEERTVDNDELNVTIVVAGQAVDTPVENPVENVKNDLQGKIDKVNSSIDEINSKIDSINSSLENASKKEDQAKLNSQIAELQAQVASSQQTAIALSIVAIVLAVITCGASLFIVLKKKH